MHRCRRVASPPSHRAAFVFICRRKLQGKFQFPIVYSWGHKSCRCRQEGCFKIVICLHPLPFPSPSPASSLHFPLCLLWPSVLWPLCFSSGVYQTQVGGGAAAVGDPPAAAASGAGAAHGNRRSPLCLCHIASHNQVKINLIQLQFLMCRPWMWILWMFLPFFSHRCGCIIYNIVCPKKRRHWPCFLRAASEKLEKNLPFL